MKKIKIAHFKNSQKSMYINGGIIFSKNSKITLKCFFKTVVNFDTNTFRWKTLQEDIIGYKTVLIFDENCSYECMFFKKHFENFKKEFINFKS